MKIERIISDQAAGLKATETLQTNQTSKENQRQQPLIIQIRFNWISERAASRSLIIADGWEMIEYIEIESIEEVTRLWFIDLFFFFVAASNQIYSFRLVFLFSRFRLFFFMSSSRF